MNLINEIEEKITRALSNSGTENTGASNTGCFNTGCMNGGGMNSGDLNNGDYNTGECNSGDYNAGVGNIGCYNTGNFNRGSYNAGDFNLCNDSSGVFCTEQQKIKVFDIDSGLTLEDWRKSDTYKILSKLCVSKWIVAGNMSVEEKRKFFDYRVTGGYLKEVWYKEAFAILWLSLTAKERGIIIEMPNFDKNKFLLITGIEV